MRKYLSILGVLGVSFEADFAWPISELWQIQNGYCNLQNATQF